MKKEQFAKLTLGGLLVYLLMIIGIVAAAPKALAQSDAVSPKRESYTLNIHLFYSKTCPHCAAEKAFLETLRPKYPNLKVNLYEITTNGENMKLFIAVGKALNADISSVPFLVVGSNYVVGYFNDESSGVEIEQTIIKAFDTQPYDVVSGILATQNNQTTTSNNEARNLVFNLPFLGKLNANNLSLPVFTSIVAILDGFNPCAMWVLLFLISLLLGAKDRKKMWILGGAFIFFSGLVYFMFLAAWLNFFLFIGYSTIVRYIIGVLAISTGLYYLRDYYKNREGGCETTRDEKRQRLFERIKKIIQKESLLLALIGIGMLAFAVNLVELLCSSGLPAIFTRVLTLNHLPKWQYYMYMLWYILLFLIDDIIVFTIAVVTLQARGIESKYGRYSHLFGGIIMLVIGILMTLRPELLMFGK